MGRLFPADRQQRDLQRRERRPDNPGQVQPGRRSGPQHPDHRISDSTQVACPSSAPVDTLEESSTATVSGLKYDSVANQYIYNWVTLKSYAGTCRRLSSRWWTARRIARSSSSRSSRSNQKQDERPPQGGPFMFGSDARMRHHAHRTASRGRLNSADLTAFSIDIALALLLTVIAVGLLGPRHHALWRGYASCLQERDPSRAAFSRVSRLACLMLVPVALAVVGASGGTAKVVIAIAMAVVLPVLTVIGERDHRGREQGIRPCPAEGDTTQGRGARVSRAAAPPV